MSDTGDLILTAGSLRYRWIDGWAQLPASAGWPHHDLVVTGDGHIISGHPERPDVLFLDQDGAIARSWTAPVVETHGFCLAHEQGREVLWIADVGRKRHQADRYEYARQEDGKLIKCSLDGEVLAQIDKGMIGGYQADTYFSPTQIAVDPTSGELWIADGYGQSRVHHLSPQLEYLGTIDGTDGTDGTDGGGAFDCPHGVFVDSRKGEGELYIADRANHRVQVYDLQRSYRRTIGEPELRAPSVFDVDGDMLVVGDLNAQIALFDRDDRLLGTLGDGAEHVEQPGWPNRKGPDGGPVAPADLTAGRFNSPHGMTVDGAGNIYVAEWFIGGRFTKLEKLS